MHNLFFLGLHMHAMPYNAYYIDIDCVVSLSCRLIIELSYSNNSYVVQWREMNNKDRISSYYYRPIICYTVMAINNNLPIRSLLFFVYDSALFML